MYSIFDLWETAFAQWKRGVLTEEDWAKWERIIGMYKSNAGALAFWARSGQYFLSNAFSEYWETVPLNPNYSFHVPRKPSPEGP